MRKWNSCEGECRRRGKKGKGERAEGEKWNLEERGDGVGASSSLIEMF